MQPYFFPYIGYFHLIHSSDVFVVYDNIQYTKKGWINRNRILNNGQPLTISLPIKKDSDYLDINKRFIADSFNSGKLLNKIKGLYNKAPCFDIAYPLIESIIKNKEKNLFNYLYSSIEKLCIYLGINTKIVVSSSIPANHNLKSQDRVISICEEVGATTYINAIGGISLYSPEDFSKRNIDLRFIESQNVAYKQFNKEFYPWLSIIDVIMFNDTDSINKILLSYSLIEKEHND
jgi:hypothetical protein